MKRYECALVRASVHIRNYSQRDWDLQVGDIAPGWDS